MTQIRSGRMNTVATGFAAMGQPIPDDRMEAGYRALRSMGFDAGEAMHLCKSVGDLLARDQPFQAQKVAMRDGLDLTGYYRLVATLLAAPVPETP